MTNQELQIGDVVELKSGSPKMTITEIEDKIWAVCKYWDENTKRFKGNTFELYLLKKSNN